MTSTKGINPKTLIGKTVNQVIELATNKAIPVSFHYQTSATVEGIKMRHTLPKRAPAGGGWSVLVDDTDKVVEVRSDPVTKR